MPEKVPYLPIVTPHPLVKEYFAGLKHVYSFLFVRKASRFRREEAQPRVLGIGAKFIFLCTEEGVIKRVSYIEEIDRIFIQKHPEGWWRTLITFDTDEVPLIIDHTYDLRNRKHAQTHLDMLQTLNTIYRCHRGHNLAVEQATPEADLIAMVRSSVETDDMSEDILAAPAPDKFADLTETSFEAIYRKAVLDRVFTNTEILPEDEFVQEGEEFPSPPPAAEPATQPSEHTPLARPEGNEALSKLVEDLAAANPTQPIHVHVHLGGQAAGRPSRVTPEGITPGTQYVTKVPGFSETGAPFVHPAVSRSHARRPPASPFGPPQLSPEPPIHARQPSEDVASFPTPSSWVEKVLPSPVPPFDLSNPPPASQREPRTLGTLVPPGQPPGSTGSRHGSGAKSGDPEPVTSRADGTDWIFPGSSPLEPLPGPDEIVDQILKEPFTAASLYTKARTVAELPLYGSPRRDTSAVARGVRAGWDTDSEVKTATVDDSQMRAESWAEEQAARMNRRAGEGTSRARVERRQRRGKSARRNTEPHRKPKEDIRDYADKVLDRYLGGAKAPSERGTICAVVLENGLGHVKRRMYVAEWEGLGPCCVLETCEGQGGWAEYMQLNHLRKAGYLDGNQDTLLLSTGTQHWVLTMSVTAAHKWLSVIYNCCHWLRPGADGASKVIAGTGVIPPGSPRPPARILAPPANARCPSCSVERNIVETSPGVHTSYRRDVQPRDPADPPTAHPIARHYRVDTPALDTYLKRGKNERGVDYTAT